MPIGAAIGADRGDLTAEFDGESYFADWEAMLADADEPTADELAVSGFVLERYTAPVDDAARRADRPPGGACATSRASARWSSSSPT